MFSISTTPSPHYNSIHTLECLPVTNHPIFTYGGFLHQPLLCPVFGQSVLSGLYVLSLYLTGIYKLATILHVFHVLYWLYILITFGKINCCALTFKLYLQNSLRILLYMVILINISLSNCYPILTLHVQGFILVLYCFLILSLLFMDRYMCFDQECSLIMQVQISV